MNDFEWGHRVCLKRKCVLIRNKFEEWFKSNEQKTWFNAQKISKFQDSSS